MWTELPVDETCLGCEPPYSFFFDLVGKYWKSQRSNHTPLHRICTLARKQGAKFISIESSITRPDVREEIDALDANFGGGGAAQAVTISYFAAQESPEQINALPNESLLGQVILINYLPANASEFACSYIFEAILSTPTMIGTAGSRRSLLNTYVTAQAEFSRYVRGREFKLCGVYYCQQNARTNVCAHACLRMALNTIGACNPPITNQAINNALKIDNPSIGLNLEQIAKVIDDTGTVKANIINCEHLDSSAYLSILNSLVESGCVVLLVFTTSDGDDSETGDREIEHVVTVFGYTRNSDEWHPEALPVYAGHKSARYYPSAFWTDHLLLHDDNFGPYYTLISRALEVDHRVSAHYIICLHPTKFVPNLPDAAETIAANALSRWLVELTRLGDFGSGQWFKYISTKQKSFVLRTLLVRKDQYLDHLRMTRAHDLTQMTPDDIASLQSLPTEFWMVEFSLPALFTGNRSKLGEVIISTSGAKRGALSSDRILALRLPSLLVLRDADDSFTLRETGLLSHSPLFQYKDHDHQW